MSVSLGQVYGAGSIGAWDPMFKKGHIVFVSYCCVFPQGPCRYVAYGEALKSLPHHHSRVYVPSPSGQIILVPNAALRPALVCSRQ